MKAHLITFAALLMSGCSADYDFGEACGVDRLPVSFDEERKLIRIEEATTSGTYKDATGEVVGHSPTEREAKILNAMDCLHREAARRGYSLQDNIVHIDGF